MKAERWQQIETLFYRALEREPLEREDFLAQSCADQTMRQEVENLLAFHEKNKSYLNKSPFNDHANSLATKQNQLSFGQKIGFYQILRLIGAGGMGEVYLAEDTRLGRKVALKVLSPEFITVPNLVRRFQQEARAASALNHPNILTIYEVGEENSIHYIAAEFIDGATLRQIFIGRQMELGEILEIALQITSALAAAHHAGIVHRDIKPQNVMMRPDGYVKVLDFGIAKLIEGQFFSQKADSTPDTATGTILGTATYMSPEQARGLEVDARTDVWSLGVCLYEMVTRQIPFKGITTSDVIVSILERNPVSLSELAPVAPPQLEEIIKKCLAKDVDGRYQSVEELNEDLRNLQQQIEVNGASTKLLNGGDSSKRRFSTPKYNPQSFRLVGFDETQHQPLDAKTKKDYARHWAEFRKWYALLAVVTISFAIGLIATSFKPDLAKHVNLLWSKDEAKLFQLDQINRLTNTGNVVYSNVSPDGKYVGYVVQDGDQQSLWIRQVTAAPSKIVVPPASNLYKGLTFSPDSNFIYYVVHDQAKGMGILYSVSVLGGEPRRIVEDVDSPVAFAPEAKSFAFMRRFDDDNGVNSHALLIANAEGQITRKLAVHRDPDFFSRDGFAWSPDGKTIIAATTKVSDSAPKRMQLVEIQVSDGSEKQFTLHEWQEIGRVSWLGNGSGIVMTAVEGKSGPAQVVQISYPAGEVQSVTKGLNGYKSVSATNDARGIVAVESDRVSHIWTAPADKPDQMKRITPGVGRYYQTSWTPDGKIIYVSEESGNQDVWTMEADGSGAKQLTFDSATDCYPRVTPDNRYIVFASNRGGAFHLWRMDWDGGNLLEITNGANDIYPQSSPDNKSVYFMSYISGKWHTSRVSIDGGSVERVFDFPSRNQVLSSDGKNVLCLFLDEQTNSKWQVGIASINGKNIFQTLNISTNNPFQIQRWAIDGKAITYTDDADNLHNLWSYPITGSSPKKLTSFNSSDQILYFDWSSDGKNLVCLRGNRTNDVVYLDGKLH